MSKFRQQPDETTRLLSDSNGTRDYSSSLSTHPELYIALVILIKETVNRISDADSFSLFLKELICDTVETDYLLQKPVVGRGYPSQPYILLIAKTFENIHYSRGIDPSIKGLIDPTTSLISKNTSGRGAVIESSLIEFVDEVNQCAYNISIKTSRPNDSSDDTTVSINSSVHKHNKCRSLLCMLCCCCCQCLRKTGGARHTVNENITDSSGEYESNPLAIPFINPRHSASNALHKILYIPQILITKCRSVLIELNRSGILSLCGIRYSPLSINLFPPQAVRLKEWFLQDVYTNQNTCLCAGAWLVT